MQKEKYDILVCLVIKDYPYRPCEESTRSGVQDAVLKEFIDPHNPDAGISVDVFGLKVTKVA